MSITVYFGFALNCFEFLLVRLLELDPPIREQVACQFLLQIRRFEVRVQLVQRGEAVCAIAVLSVEIEDGYLLLHGVDINVEDLGRVLRVALGVDPRDVAIYHQNDVCGRCSWFDAVPESEPSRVVCFTKLV